MAVKSSEKASSKKSSPKKTRGIKKGDKYKCSICGLVVSIDEICGCMDVFEHAFMIDYSLKRADYIEALFKNIKLDVIERRVK